MGVAALAALSTSELLQEPDQNLVDVIEIDNPDEYWDIEQQERQSREPQGE